MLFNLRSDAKSKLAPRERTRDHPGLCADAADGHGVGRPAQRGRQVVGQVQGGKGAGLRRGNYAVGQRQRSFPRDSGRGRRLPP